jgi:UDP-N-acetylglucosamine--N-acetylmuramyl-(pentapeptide) pyrophosphoryl-undecaprenol N-acetylglucosamine transferase
MGIPTLVHESNAIPGKAVLKLAPRIDCVMTNFESSKESIKGAKRVVCVGNPQVLGQKIEVDVVTLADGCKKSVLSFGGSLGAETLNRAYADALVSLADEYKDTEFYHAAGKRDYEELKKIFAEKGLDKKPNVRLVDYIYDMDARMRRADLVISRAGAMTLSELALLSKAAVLVPSPFVAANHQYKNAKALYDANACELVEERDFESGRLTKCVRELLENSVKREELRKNIKTFAKADANKIIYDEIIATVKGKK